MNQKRLKAILTLEGVVCLLVVLLGGQQFITYSKFITFPFLQIAKYLRFLSLSGSLGNGVAVVLYLIIGAIPSVFLITKMVKKNQSAEDYLLPVISILVYVTLYLLINPRYIGERITPIGMEEMGKIMLCSGIYTILVGYIVLRLMRRFSESPTENLLSYLKLTLGILAIVLIFAITAVTPYKIITETNKLRTANTMSGIHFGLTDFFIVLKYIVNMIPSAFEVWIVFKGIKLIDELAKNQFSEAVVSVAMDIEKACKQAIITTIIAAMILNTSQLLVGRQLLSSDFHLQIPILSIVIVLITMVLSRYFAESRQLKEEMDMFV